jgi:hypothetical protein
MENNKQTVAEFIQDNTVTAIEVVEDLIFNLVCGEALYGIDVDTSSIPSGTKLLRTTDYTIDNNVLTYNSTNLDLNNTYMLG